MPIRGLEHHLGARIGLNQIVVFSFFSSNGIQAGNNSRSLKYAPKSGQSGVWSTDIFLICSAEGVMFWPVATIVVTTHWACIPLWFGRESCQGKTQTEVPKILTHITSLPWTYCSRKVNQPPTIHFPAQWTRKITESWCWLETDSCHIIAPLRVTLTELVRAILSVDRDANSVIGGSLYKEGKVAWDRDWYEFWDKGEWFGCLVRAHKEPDWKVCDKVAWGSGMMMNLWLWAQSLYILY